MNKVILIGNLTRDPEFSNTNNGTAVCKISIAVNRNFANAQGEKECDFFNIVAWKKLAENCSKYLRKGKKMAVVGSMQTRSYENKDGEKKTVTEIMADEIEFLSPMSEGESNEPTPPQGKKKISELQPVDDEDLPF